jgi:hypothetical protein
MAAAGTGVGAAPTKSDSGKFTDERVEGVLLIVAEDAGLRPVPDAECEVSG